MSFTFTTADAQIVFGFVGSVVVPFVVSYLKRCHWSNGLRLGVAVLLSIVAGVLSQYVAGALDGGSVIVATVGIFTASQAHFATWFRGLGFEKMLNPDEAEPPTSDDGIYYGFDH